MSRLLAAVLITSLPALAFAHPDHSQQAYSLAHYFTGSHLIMLLMSVAAVTVAGYMIKKSMVKNNQQQ